MISGLVFARSVDLDDAPLRYGKPGWLNPDFVCHGGPEGMEAA